MDGKRTVSANCYLTSADYEEIKFILLQFDLDDSTAGDTLRMALEYAFTGEARASLCRMSRMAFEVIKRYVLDPKFEAEKAKDNGEEQQNRG